jgi:hypothetical protein
MAQRTKKHRTNLAGYAGKWVALARDQVIAMAPSLPELMRKVPRQTSRRQPSVFLVPRRDEGPYVLLFLRR